jgi:PAS domain S-box-containing protein
MDSGPRAVMIVPDWTSDERLHGLIWAHSARHRIFTEDEAAFVQTVAALVGESMARGHAESEFQFVVESAPDGIVRFDRDLRYVYVNSAIERILGTPNNALIGKTIGDVAMPESVMRTWALVLGQALRTGREQTVGLAMPTSVGPRYFESRNMPELGVDGTVQSLLSIWRDVTEQRTAEAERAAAYREMAGQQARLTELLSRLEHEHTQELQRTARAIRAEQLTRREQAILGLVVRGWTNREIAQLCRVVRIASLPIGETLIKHGVCARVC